jgi:ketosteroid isomerase-like protein
VSAEENMALVRRFLKAHIKGNLDQMDEMMAPDYVRHTRLLPPSSDSFTNTLVIRARTEKGVHIAYLEPPLRPPESSLRACNSL